MKYVGAHVSIAGGVENAPGNAIKIGAKAFAMFSKNQRQWKAKKFTDDNISSFRKNLVDSGIKPEHVLTHDSYLINLGNPDPEKRKKAIDAFITEAERVEELGLSLLNFHPGSHLNQISEDHCIELIAEAVCFAIEKIKGVVFVLETTAGQGSNIGYSFEHLAKIISLVNNNKRIGVCLDTCHIFAAGYDIKDNYKEVMNLFDEILGFNMLKGVHLNDSKATLAQKLDRHDSLGKGKLGWPVFENIMNDSRFDDIPLILETINSDIWAEEITKLYSLQAL